MNKSTCTISGEEFQVSQLEIELRQKFEIEGLPTTAPWIRLRHLAAFWQHWALHNRKCNYSGKNIISAFSEKCPYPVWHKDEWIKNANPPHAEFDETKPFFEQAWELFQQCPIPHKIGARNENCDYTDDCWFSRNVYLSHSVLKGRDIRHCYRSYAEKNSAFDAYSKDTELCVDLTNCFDCFETLHSVNCRNVRNSAFLFDCRNCSDCLFCCNVRNKQYCFGNRQLTKEAFLEEKQKWDFTSRNPYEHAKQFFQEMVQTQAYFRATHIMHSENCTGDDIEASKNCQNSFFLNEAEDCQNFLRGGLNTRDILDGVCVALHTELVFNSTCVQDYCYQVTNSFNLSQCRSCDYCTNCFQCENCFGCCGLMGKKYHILNKEYSPEEYKDLREKIITHMKQTQEWNQFFPGHFAPNPYEESLAGFHFPLTKEEQTTLGFRLNENEERANQNYSAISEIPDSIADITNEQELLSKIFWDSEFKKPFQITSADIDFAKKLNSPLPNSYYMNRIQENFRWIPFNGKLRDCACGKCDTIIATSWPEKYNSRILCEECYLDNL